ncbi:hypothetical protein CVU82_00280 [Candidatus Falkowbacteria bacterium HGW-Falkowbacteria-1]|jgi:hypothetical protein|uniref:Uncharacterized protein n=1 Tax=Candidatus Falkowbacteria bacterium HGW-Falkowbacteria-1 TaxID=2013768 RepID=A0A2N2EAD2_9BACT|nr:MAG: hypothetical protein CVU82_00280 [Candidatus Falkowbacteria bacterium HGW-Falkowbacteria-1]
MNFETKTNNNEEIDVLENKESESGQENKGDKEAYLRAAEKAKEDLEMAKEGDKALAGEEVEKARKSIFEKIAGAFKGKEKSEEEKYENEMKSFEKLIKSLTHVSSSTLELGASFSGGIDFDAVKSPELRSKLDEIIDLNKKIAKTDKGQEKVDLLYKKKELIQRLARTGRTELKNKYNIAA